MTDDQSTSDHDGCLSEAGEAASHFRDSSVPVAEGTATDSPDHQAMLDDHEPHESDEPRCSLCAKEVNGIYYHINDEVACPRCRERIAARMTKGSPALRIFGALALGLVAAAVVGSLYPLGTVASGYRSGLDNFTFGFIGLAVGFAVGHAVKLGSRNRGGWVYQGLAMVLTYCATVAAFIPDIHRTMTESEASNARPISSAVGAPAETMARDDVREGPSESAVIWDELNAGEKTAYCLLLYGAAFLTPVVVLPFGIEDLGDVIWLLAIVVALGIAWYKNRRFEITITGPFESEAR
jgi:DNA-directed RNA polymerase subunit RPC12/RpoP